MIVMLAPRTHLNARKNPFVLVIIGVPRLIISFPSGCMKSVRIPWLFLFEYFISFLPSLLIPLVYIFPSEIYRKELQIVIRQCLHRS
ncbi:unnamed protein product [Rotaria sordida]|uniref:Uncharacterized protein n=1 Tax=Rotaria sordida TaxID=392033 RepID=A0A818VZ29_9BILA|nr:unnamed protein product [Rotaria sordida]CAF1412132.1 unnamed protein product [Rotaria sordida]CAF3717800.1 unnamed protein product [Rotaria sordida]CAF4015797.1 unnamed protein product [Rotaria sordida]